MSPTDFYLIFFIVILQKNEAVEQSRFSECKKANYNFVATLQKKIKPAIVFHLYHTNLYIKYSVYFNCK